MIIAAIGAAAPVAGAFQPPIRAGSARQAPAVDPQPVAVARTHSPGARFVPEVVWQHINDAMLMKLLNRQ